MITALLPITVRYADVLDMTPNGAASVSSSNSRPNTARECAIRNTLAGLPCMTCGEAVDWTNGQHGSAGSAWLGHVIARECWTRGGGYVGGNIGAHCRTCQYDAKHLSDGGRDLTAYIIPGTVPDKFLSNKNAGEDIRKIPCTVYIASADERRAARKARWGW